MPVKVPWMDKDRGSIQAMAFLQRMDLLDQMGVDSVGDAREFIRLVGIVFTKILETRIGIEDHLVSMPYDLVFVPR